MSVRRIARFFRNVVSTSMPRRLEALRSIGHLLIPDYRFSWHQMDWWGDADFNRYLELFDERSGFNSHRRWALCQLLRLTAAVPGDTAECGVYRGASSWLICSVNQQQALTRRHHMFDSFQGLSRPSDKDGDYWSTGNLAAEEDIVRRNLSAFEEQLRFHKGWIPTRFEDVSDLKFAFVHIDVDLYEPTRDSLRFFYDRLSPSGVVICDDYGFTSCPGATQAVDEFLAEKPEKAVSLSGGGGFFIKGVETMRAVGNGSTVTR